MKSNCTDMTLLKNAVMLFVIANVSVVRSFGQGEIPVNMYSGSATVLVDLYTLKDHDLAEPIRLAYNVNDVNLNGSHTYGVGWDLTCSNQQVSREVRGLPDDFKGGAGDPRLGWLYNTNYASITSFPASSDLSTATTADEQSDNTFLANNGYLNDTEPDLFSFSVGEYAGKFVFGNDGLIKLIPYQDILITPTYQNAPTDLTITGWTITTNSGVTYTLNETCSVTRTLSKSSDPLVDPGVDQTALKLFERDYQLYKTATLYTSSWLLKNTVSPTGATLTYTYHAPETSLTVEQKDARIFDGAWSPASNPIYKSLFKIMKETLQITSKTIAGISSSVGTSVTFESNTKITIQDLSRSASPFKEFTFTYAYGFLTAVAEYDPVTCIQLPPYQMYYNEPELYPGSSSGQDFWGFYNGADNVVSVNGVTTLTSVPTIYVYPDENAYERYRLYPIPNYTGNQVILTGDANRLPNAGTMTIGTLQRLVYPEGGESYFRFEPNTYYDAKAGQDQLGGGLRVGSVTYFDGVNPGANITKNLIYTDSQGRSSGRLISRPSFAVPVWQMVTPSWGVVGSQTTYAGYTKLFSAMSTLTEKWRGTTVVTGFDLSSQEFTSGSAVGYAQVKVMRPGSGNAVFEYILPAKYGDTQTGGNVTDWTPSVTRFARPNTNPSMNIITTGEAGLYSLFPNAYYDYERGLLLRKSEYSEAGALVRLTENTYQYVFKSGAQPSSVVGIAYDRLANTNSNDNIFLYARYQLISDVARVIASETVKTYDESNVLKFVTESTAFSYGSPYHKLLSKVDKTIPGGSVYSTTFKYTLDYPVTSTVPADSSLWMIKMLKDARRFATVIEQVNSVQPAGGTQRVTGATLYKFRPFSFNKPLLREVMIFRPASPVTNFVSSGVVSYAFSNDTRYESVQKIHEYTTYDIPLSSTGEDRVTASSLWGYNKRVPVAQVVHALNTNVGFSDFETNNQSEFSESNSFYGLGRTGARGIHPYATLERTIVKPSSAARYLLTFWLKNTTGTSVTLRVTLKNVNGTVISQNNYAYSLSSNEYQMFTLPVDVSGLPSTFVINIQGQGLSQPGASSSSLLPMLDDISFCPDYASITSATYDMPFGVSSSTDESGRTGYTVFDNIGRVKWIKDQDKNIRQFYTYSFPGEQSATLVANVTGIVGSYYAYKPIQFIADPNACVAGAMYSWDLDGNNVFTTASSSNISPVKTFPAAGGYSVTLRVTHPDYAQPLNFTYYFTLTLEPIPVTICGSGVETMTNGVVTSSFTCFTNTSGPNWVSFKIVSPPSDDGETYTYQWKKRNVGDTVWTNTGTNARQLPFQKVELTTPSFQVMCTVTLANGRTGDSGIMTVTVN